MLFMKKTNRNDLETALEKITIKHHGSHIKKRGSDAVIYTRVSSQEQAQNNGSLEVQKKYCDEFCQKHKITICRYFGGTFESAKTDGRKEFQRMLEYVKKHKNIGYIVIHNFDRFSRTGSAAAQLSENLRSEGVIVTSVTQEIDSSTAMGRMQENVFHLMNNFDNRMKSDRTKINTREVMIKGYWPYATPLGYLNLKPKHRACNHEYIITPAGKELAKAFKIFLTGKLNNLQIIELLRAKGLDITEKSFRYVFSNPFYAGYITGKLVAGKLIKGKHPALINLKTFLEVQKKLTENPISGVPKITQHDEVPLKIFAKDESSGLPFTGYKTKGNWYYKLKRNLTPVNVSAKVLNTLFVTTLAQFEYKNTYKSSLAKRLLQKIKCRLSENAIDNKSLKKNISEKQMQLNRVEQKFINDQISEEVYQKHATTIKAEIDLLSKELENSSVTSSNLEMAVEKSLDIAQNLSSAWVSASYSNKQRLQSLVFPEGIMYDKKKGSVRTSRVNSFFEAIPQLASVSAENKNGDSMKNRQKSCKVPRTGFEPAHPCERCDLNTVRLPISPPGQV
jgi:site-specific DNA recombinase